MIIGTIRNEGTRHMPDQTLSATILIRKPEVLRRVGVDYSTLHRWLKTGEHGFPQPVIINPNAARSTVAWVEAEVEAWLSSRPRGPAAKPAPAVYAARQRQAAAKRRADPPPRVAEDGEPEARPRGPIMIRRPQ
jgi:prophage regulatory protein